MFGPQVAVFGLILFMVAVVVIALWIIPLLRRSPSAMMNYTLYHRGRMMGKGAKLSTTQTVRYKLMGLKQKLLSALIVLGGVTIYIYDNWSPVFGNIDYTPIMAKLGNNGALFVNVGATLLLLFFRKLSEKRN
jgi:hypothetical protein